MNIFEHEREYTQVEDISPQSVAILWVPEKRMVKHELILSTHPEITDTESAYHQNRT